MRGPPILARARCLRSALPLLLAAPAAQAQLAASSLHVYSRAELCVTEGSLAPGTDGVLTVAAAKMRAVARVPGADAVELRFTYLRPTQSQSALGSGAVREQLGVKLLALDPCNLVYVMWRLSPTPGLIVQTKSNAGEHTSRECGNHGYRTVRPRMTAALPALLSGGSHVLAAQIVGDQLRASVDGRRVWQGELGPGWPMRGVVGVRSDNVRMSFTLAGALDRTSSAGALSACQEDAGD